MIELKINGPNKSRIINSLRGQFKSQNHNFRLMRFKAIPAKTMAPLVHLSQVTKLLQLQNFPESKTSKPDLNTYMDQMQPYYRIKFKKERQNTNVNQHCQSIERTKSNLQTQMVHFQYKKIRTQPNQQYYKKQQILSSSNHSIQNPSSHYINGSSSLNIQNPRGLSLNYQRKQKRSQQLYKMIIQNERNTQLNRRQIDNKRKLLSLDNPLKDLHAKKSFQDQISLIICKIKQLPTNGPTYPKKPISNQPSYFKKTASNQPSQNKKLANDQPLQSSTSKQQKNRAFLQQYGPRFLKNKFHTKQLETCNNQRPCLKNSLGPWHINDFNPDIR